MDKKKIIIFGLMVAFVAIVILLTCSGNNKSGSGNFSISVLDEKEYNLNSTNCFYIIDASGSMKGYVDSPKNHHGFISKLTSTVTFSISNLRNNYHCNISGICGKNNGIIENRKLDEKINDKSIYQNGDTKIKDLFSEAANHVNDSTVVIIVSDLVLSYGGKAIDSFGQEYNKEKIYSLRNEVYDQMQQFRNDGCHVLVLQYYGQFNGNYYYNYTENRRSPKIYKDSILENRPYYLVVIGKADKLRAIAKADVFEKPVHRWSSLKLDNYTSKEVNLDVPIAPDNVQWEKGADRTGAPMLISTRPDPRTSYFTIDFPRFYVPWYVADSTKELEIKHSANISFVETIKPYCNYKIHLKEQSLLEEGEVFIRWQSNNDWIDSASTDDDTDVTQSIEKKTWGFYYLMDGIMKAYNAPEQQIIAEFKFNINPKK